MERKKIHLEYLLNATSKSILWAAISTPTGLEAGLLIGFSQTIKQ